MNACCECCHLLFHIHAVESAILVPGTLLAWPQFTSALAKRLKRRQLLVLYKTAQSDPFGAPKSPQASPVYPKSVGTSRFSEREKVTPLSARARTPGETSHRKLCTQPSRQVRMKVHKTSLHELAQARLKPAGRAWHFSYRHEAKSIWVQSCAMQSKQAHHRWQG